MSSVYFLYIAAFLLISTTAQAKPTLEEDSLVEELQKWAKEKLLGAVDDLKKAEQQLKDTVMQAIEDSQKKLEEEYVNIIKDYQMHKETLHPECYDKSLKNLISYKPKKLLQDEELLFEQNIDNYMKTGATTVAPPSCTVAAMEDVGLMLYVVAKYIATIFNTLDDIINGYTICSQGAWYKKVTCIFTYIGTAFHDMYETLGGVSDLIEKLTMYGSDIRQQITNCTVPHKLLIRQQLLVELDNAQKCTNMYKY